MQLLEQGPSESLLQLFKSSEWKGGISQWKKLDRVFTDFHCECGHTAGMHTNPTHRHAFLPSKLFIFVVRFCSRIAADSAMPGSIFSFLSQNLTSGWRFPPISVVLYLLPSQHPCGQTIQAEPICTLYPHSR